MSALWYGIIAVCILLAVVFAVRRNRPTGGGDAPQAPASAAQPQAAPPVPMRSYTPGPLLTRRNPAFFAVIAAAVAEVMASEGRNPEGGFVIRDVKTIRELVPGPAITSKDDAFFAVVAGAISQVLESEGKNPEGGFAIRGIKAL